jgi:uncharacterized protein YkwD
MSLKTKLLILSSILGLNVSFAYAAAVESETSIQNAVLFYINEYRQHHGLSKLTMDSRMVAQAKQHSQDMANHRMGFGHKYFEQRIATLRSQIKNTGAGSENVAYNYKNAREVVQQWVKSPGHRRNIEGHFNLTGVGVARDKQGKLYYTQMFLQAGANNATRGR